MTIHASDDLVGGRYLIGAFVGQGGMQEVYRATDLLLDRIVALKTPKNESAEKRFKRSAVVSAKVNHANVAKTLDYLEEGGRAYLVEEFIEGSDLGKVLKDEIRILDPQATARTLHRLAKGLAASHHADVIHRDIKPSNVMSVGGALLHEVKLTDFGIAKLAEEELEEAIEGGDESITASQTAIGALPYMAPEMIDSIKDAGRPADVWSLGCLAYELLTGTKPFGAGLRAVSAIQKGILPPLPPTTRKTQFAATADAVSAIIAKCVVTDPIKRLTADQLVSECEGLCYPVADREYGTVTSVPNQWFGFIRPDTGEKGVFYHNDSIYGSNRAYAGDRVIITRYNGGGNDRAFPVLRLSK